MLTTKGMATALLGGLGMLAGLALDNPLFLAASLLALAMLVLAVLTLRGAELRLRRVVRAETVSEGDAVPVELRVEMTARHGKSLLELRDTLPGEIALADGNNYAILDLKAGEAAELRYAIRCPVKGYHTIGPVRVRVEDPFGLFHIDKLLGGQSTLKVYPKVENLKDAVARSKYPFVTTGPFLVGNPGQGSSFFALREYTRGDSFRDINWKASARSKNLVVNQREKESQSEATILLDARLAAQVGTVADNTFLYSCRAAASIADFFVHGRNRIRLVVYGEQLARVGPGGSFSVSREVLEQVTLQRAAGEQSLGGVIDAILASVKPKTPVYLLSNLIDDPGIERAIAALRAQDARVVVISPDAHAFALAARQRSGQPAGPESDAQLDVIREERARVIDALRGTGAMVLDWQPGDNLSVALVKGVI